jgi:hypothetical protein
MTRRTDVLPALFLSMLAGSAWAQAQSFDIAGLRMGMTEDEAIATLEAFDPQMELTVIEGYFNYSDGVSNFETDNYPSEIRGTRPGSRSRDDFILMFTPPPNGGRLWLVDRREDIKSDFPSAAQYGEALRQKYGEPSIVSNEELLFAWELPAGGPACLRDRLGPVRAYFQPRRHTDLLYRLHYMQQVGQAPADLTTCAVQLNYQLGSTNNQVVQSFNAIMIDVAGFSVANDAANEWVQGLEAEARRQREGGGKAPRL